MDDSSLLEAFEACSLPASAFSHREHLRVAWLCLTSGAPFEEGASRFCRGLRRYVTSLGKADRYHETITWAFLALVSERQHACEATAFEIFAQANQDLFVSEPSPLLRFYDRATLGSARARRVFVLPRD